MLKEVASSEGNRLFADAPRVAICSVVLLRTQNKGQCDLCCRRWA